MKRYHYIDSVPATGASGISTRGDEEDEYSEMVCLYPCMVAHGKAMIGPILVLLALSALSSQPAPPPPPFIARCATCHGDEARGTARGPGLVMNPRVAAQSVEQLRGYLQRGNPGAGMPAFADLPADDLLALARYLRRINVDTIMPPPADVPARRSRGARPNPGTGARTTGAIRPTGTAR